MHGARTERSAGVEHATHLGTCTAGMLAPERRATPKFHAPVIVRASVNGHVCTTIAPTPASPPLHIKMCARAGIPGAGAPFTGIGADIIADIAECATIADDAVEVIALPESSPDAPPAVTRDTLPITSRRQGFETLNDIPERERRGHDPVRRIVRVGGSKRSPIRDDIPHAPRTRRGRPPRLPA